MAFDDHLDRDGTRPNRCPSCSHPVQLDTPDYFGEVICPGCGQTLFFVRVGREAVFRSGPTAGQLHQQLVSLIAAQLGIDKQHVTPQTSFVDDLAQTLSTLLSSSWSSRKRPNGLLATNVESTFEFANYFTSGEFPTARVASLAC